MRSARLDLPEAEVMGPSLRRRPKEPALPTAKLMCRRWGSGNARPNRAASALVSVPNPVERLSDTCRIGLRRPFGKWPSSARLDQPESQRFKPLLLVPDAKEHIVKLEHGPRIERTVLEQMCAVCLVGFGGILPDPHERERT